MDLHEYEKIKFELAEILRAAPFEAAQFERRRILFARLAEDRFNLVVLGRFSRGKSSLMNAILGMNRLPTGVVPLTSVITTVTYGSDDRVTLHYLDSRLIDDISIAQLPNYITELGNPGNMRRIETAEVQLPAEILRRGFHFIDTPGLGSSIRENSSTTEAFLPEADALILVTSFDSALSTEELEVLRAAQTRNLRVFLVINKRDTVSRSEQEQVYTHISTQLVKLFGGDLPTLFALSSRDALEAKLSADPEALIASGLGALEQALIAFLVHGKRQEFLLSMCGRLAQTLAGSPNALAHLEQLRATLQSAPVPLPAASALPDQELPSNLGDCEICLRIEQSVFQFLTKYQSRLSRDPAVRKELVARHGLCGPHAWQFARVAAPREICTAFSSILLSQAANLRAIAGDEKRSAFLCEAVERIKSGPADCPVCQIALATQTQTAGALAAQLTAAGPALPHYFCAICIPHLGAVLAAIESSQIRAALLSREAAILERWAGDMRRFALKQDAAQRWALNKEESGAAQRGSQILVGMPAAYVPPGSGGSR